MEYDFAKSRLESQVYWLFIKELNCPNKLLEFHIRLLKCTHELHASDLLKYERSEVDIDDYVRTVVI